MATITSTATVNSRANITKRINKKQQQNNLLNNIISKTLEFYQSHLAMYQDLSGSIKKISTSLNDISDTIPLDAKHVSAILGILAKNDTQSIEYILNEEAKKYVDDCKKTNLIPDNFDRCKEFLKSQFTKLTPECPQFTDDFVIFWCGILQSEKHFNYVFELLN